MHALRSGLLQSVILLLGACAVDVGSEEAVSSRAETLTGSSDDIAPSGIPDRALSQARRDAAVRVFSSATSCTGVLITPRLVITGKHCVTDAGPYSVQFTVRRGGTAEPGLPAPFRVSARACIGSPHATYNLAGVCPALPPGGPCGDISRIPDGCAIVSVAARHDLAVLVLARRVERNRTDNYPALPMAPDFSSIAEDARARLAGYGGTATGEEVLPTFRRFRTATFDFDEAEWSGPFVVRAGDSGGPLYAGDPDDPSDSLRLLGILSGSAFDPDDARPGDLGLISTGASLEHPLNRDWLEPQLAHMQTIQSTSAPGGSYEVWTGPVDAPPRGEPGRFLVSDVRSRDPDGDGLFAEHDNCPLLANPDQADDDGGQGDGVGDATLTVFRTDGLECNIDCENATDEDDDRVFDACDNCPGVSNFGLDGPGATYAQRDCDADGVGDACTPDRDGDGIPDPCDACPDFAVSSSVDCNVDGEIADDATQLPDPCDPNPCATGGAGTRLVDSVRMTNDLIAGEGLITTGTPDSTLAATIRTGFRFCPCPFDDPARRARCADDPSVGCIVDRREYSATLSPWRPMTLSFDIGHQVSPSEAIVRYDRPRDDGLAGGADYEAAWSFEADAAAAGSLETDPTGTSRTRAVFWSLAVDYDRPLTRPMRDTCNLSHDCPPLDGNLNSHYWAAIVESPPLRPYCCPTACVRPAPPPSPPHISRRGSAQGRVRLRRSSRDWAPRTSTSQSGWTPRSPDC